MKNFFKLDEHFITSSPEKKSIKIIDPIGQFILESLEAGITEKTISHDIADAFSLSSEKAKHDVALFLEQYNKEIAIDIPFDFSLTTKKATLLTTTHTSTQLVIFPSFILQIKHENEESLRLLRPLFMHLETQFPSPITIDYKLLIQKNSNQHWEVILDKNILISGDDLATIILPALAHMFELAFRKDPYLILLHASGVTYKESSIIFPAIGGSGKSTLCAALIKNGFGYINDDVIPVAYDSGELITIPFCLGIKQGSWQVLEKYYPDIEQQTIFGRNNLNVKYLPPVNQLYQKSYKAKFLVIPYYKKGNSCSIEKTTAINGLKAIIEGESLMKLPLEDKDIDYLISWLKDLECYTLTYDSLEEAMKTIKETLF